MERSRDKKSIKESKKVLMSHKDTIGLRRQSSIKQLHLENLQKPKTLLIIYYKQKRLSIPVFGKCDNVQLFIRRNIVKFEHQILRTKGRSTGKKKVDSVKNIVSFRTTDRDILKDYYIWLGRDISVFKLLQLEPMWKTPISRGFSNFEIERCIGYGGFSQVYLARRITDGCFCALKVIDKKLIREQNRVDMVRNQDDIMRMINHPFVVKMHGSFETSRHVVFILQYYPGGQLFYHLRRIKKMSEAEARFYFVEIVLAFDYLHQHRILYRDIKPQNIMMDAEGHLILADFGLAKIGLGKTHKTFSFCGSHEYMAPEMVEEQGHNYMLDYYCLGALLYELVIGFPPFYSHDKNKIFQSIRHEEIGFPETTDLSHEIKWIIRDLLKKDPRERFGSLNGVREILSHPWLKKTNIKAMLSKQIEPPLRPNLLQFNMDEKDVPQNSQQIRGLYSYPEVEPEILVSLDQESPSNNKYDFHIGKPKRPSPIKRSKSRKKHHNQSLRRQSSNNTIKRITSNSKFNVNISINRKIQISPKVMSPSKLKRARSADNTLAKVKSNWREPRHHK